MSASSCLNRRRNKTPYDPGGLHSFDGSGYGSVAAGCFGSSFVSSSFQRRTRGEERTYRQVVRRMRSISATATPYTSAT